MSDEQTLGAEVSLGEEFEEWLESNVGRYMVAGFEAYEQEAQESLCSIWPWRKWRIVQLQERVKLARKFQAIAAEAIIRGRQAQQDLETPPE